MLNKDTIQDLIYAYRDDGEMLEFIEEAILSFEKYHSAIIALEAKQRLYRAGAMSGDAYREIVPQMDAVRTACHNTVLSNVSALNRMAEQEGLPAVYDGVISKEQPHRRQVADAVMEYLRWMIEERS